MMKRAVFYFAAPLRPNDHDLMEVPTRRYERGTGEYEAGAEFLITTEERHQFALRTNIDRALRGLAWLHATFPDITFAAPQIATALTRENATQQETGLIDGCAVVERCNGILLYGGRISSGMLRKVMHGQRHVIDFCVIDFSSFSEPPPDTVLRRFDTEVDKLLKAARAR